MADEDLEQFDTTEEDEDGQEFSGGGGKSSLLSKLAVLLFLLTVVAVECGVAYYLIPDATGIASLAGAAPVLPEEDPLDFLAPDETPQEDQVEVDLGSFVVTAYQPITDTTLRIDFLLYGTVATEDKDEFEELLLQSEHRFRDQVIATVRSAEVRDVTEAGLGLIKRKILEKTNRTLGKPLLKAVIFSQFSFMES